MEILKNSPKAFGRFVNLLAPGRPARSIAGSPAGKVSLTMGNEIMGEWLWLKKNLR
ncbi:MAG: hypothetical protein LLG06_08880 [Desulfobacteraceae bacterium]|nr:hypothetical protein [Desulfobacteraceae bacterium]